MPRTRIFGAVLAIGIMSGAIFFHLFTPLGVVILGDGGELFTLACGVWISGWIILALSAMTSAHGSALPGTVSAVSRDVIEPEFSRPADGRRCRTPAKRLPPRSRS